MAATATPPTFHLRFLNIRPSELGRGPNRASVFSSLELAVREGRRTGFEFVVERCEDGAFTVELAHQTFRSVGYTDRASELVRRMALGQL